MKEKNWRDDYVLVVTYDEEFEMTRHRWVHRSIQDPVRYVTDFYPFERPML